MINGKTILSRITTKLEVIPMVEVTPKDAEDLLTLNDENRHVTPVEVAQYTADQIAGNWIFTGQTMCISREMKLLNGQHTLLAQVESGKTLLWNIQTGLEPKSFNVMDIGRKRSAADVMQLRGVRNYTTSAAAVKTILLYRKHGRIDTHRIGYKNRLPNQEFDNWAASKTNMKVLYDGMDFIVALLGNTNRSKFLSLSNWIFVYWLLVRINEPSAKAFLELLINGENLSKSRSAPIYFCREKLMQIGEDIKGVARGGRHMTETKVRYILRAWNAWRTKEELTKLEVPKGQVELEKPV